MVEIGTLSRRIDFATLRTTDDNVFPGAHSGGATPVPIPNTEVKTSSADGTAWATMWESRSVPGNPRKPGGNSIASGFFIFVLVGKIVALMA